MVSIIRIIFFMELYNRLPKMCNSFRISVETNEYLLLSDSGKKRKKPKHNRKSPWNAFMAFTVIHLVQQHSACLHKQKTSKLHAASVKKILHSGSAQMIPHGPGTHFSSIYYHLCTDWNRTESVTPETPANAYSSWFFLFLCQCSWTCSGPTWGFMGWVVKKI